MDRGALAPRWAVPSVERSEAIVNLTTLLVDSVIHKVTQQVKNAQTQIMHEQAHARTAQHQESIHQQLLNLQSIAEEIVDHGIWNAGCGRRGACNGARLREQRGVRMNLRH